MDQVNEFLGIDISKQTFDTYNEKLGSMQFSNNQDGFVALLQLLDEGYCCVMEATGAYHHRLANFLFEAGIMVSVANALVIKRFGQMKLKKHKTDKADAQLIYLFAEDQGVDLWEPKPTYIEECRSMQTVVSLYIKQNTQLKNKLEFLQGIGETKGAVVRFLKAQLKRLQVEIKKIEQVMQEKVKEHDQELLTHITNIPGIGIKTAIFLIIHTNGLREFENSRQLISYLGLAPIEQSSGSSIRAVSRISHAGNPKIRSMMLLCSFTAHKCNPQCAALFNRIVAKGKSPKLALIAVANKLLKQVFAIAKSRMPYDSDYRSVKLSL